jgi:hypothetical protein
VAGESDSERDDADDDDDGDATEALRDVRVTNQQAANAMDVLLRYFEQSDLATADDMQPLSAIKRRLDYMRQSTQKQSSIMDFFSRRMQ